MKIQDVVRKGGNFKRGPWVGELKIRSQEFAPFCHFLVRSEYLDEGDTFELAVEDIMAEDWENVP